MQIVAFVESVDHVCCRYRLAAFQGDFAESGHNLELRQLPKTTVGRLSLGRGLASADAVIVQRKLLSPWLVALLRRRVKRLIFDFDDAVWLRDSYSSKGFEDPRRTARFRTMISASDLIIAGNDYLAAEARRWTSAERVVVIPTCVDPTVYPIANHREREALDLVWVGSGSTLQGLKRLAPTLSAVGRAVPGTRLKLVCDQSMFVPNLPIVDCPWSEQTEGTDIASADVGIGWVPDDPWSRGKCGLKVLQYQAAGLPVIANPVGVQAEFVRDGETGYRAESVEEWIAAVRRLQDVNLRSELGLSGRRRVEFGYSIRAGAGRWMTALHRFAADFRTASLTKAAAATNLAPRAAAHV